MPHVELRDGERLYYESHGDGPPLLLVAGLGGVGTFWQRHVAALSGRFRVVIHDHRGCGRSSHSRIDYSVEQMADDVCQLMDGLGIARAHYIGHSTGGAIGQTIALDQPERLDRLVLSATWPAADAYFRRLFEVRSEGLAGLGPDYYGRLGSLFMYPAWWFSRNAAALDAAAAATIPPTPPEIVASRIAAILRFDRRRDVPRIGHRTLVVCARDDTVTPAYFSEELAQAIPDARLVVLPTGGHFYNHVVPEEFERLVLDFLADM